jgi:hypothetical protein
MYGKTLILTLAFLLLTFCEAAAQREPKIPDDLEITLQRTVCFGSCPDYTISIDAHRKVMFTGREFTKRNGTAIGRISKAALVTVITKFDQIDLDSFADDYSDGGVCETYATDMPSEIISLRRNGRIKTVNHYFGCWGKEAKKKLEPLVNLGKMIDRLTNSKRWVGK